MDNDNKATPEIAENIEKRADYCCIGDIEEAEKYMPKFEPLPLLYFTEEQGSKSKK